MNAEIPDNCFDILQDENEPLSKKYRLVNLMQYEVKKKILKLQQIENSYRIIAKNFQEEALQAHKDNQIKILIAKYGDIKRPTKQMLDDFAKIEKREKMGCYHLSGVTVIQDDCNFCEKRKICERGEYQYSSEHEEG